MSDTLTKRICTLRETYVCGSEMWITLNDAANEIVGLRSQLATAERERARMVEALTAVLSVVANEHSGSSFISPALERQARAALQPDTRP